MERLGCSVAASPETLQATGTSVKAMRTTSLATSTRVPSPGWTLSKGYRVCFQRPSFGRKSAYHCAYLQYCSCRSLTVCSSSCSAWLAFLPGCEHMVDQDWNLILNETGGPNHVNNVCDAAMQADLSRVTFVNLLLGLLLVYRVSRSSRG